ncbi:MAG: hypothetical protein IE890_02015, partial [Arcobacter sp.]|nr:hypothetical protein [Arcobacter sp.]
ARNVYKRQIDNDEIGDYLGKIGDLEKPVLTKAGSIEPIIKEIDKWL